MLVRAGDMILIAPGTYDERVMFRKSGTRDAPITIRGASRDRVIWTSSLPDPAGWHERYALNLRSQRHVAVENITFRDCYGWIMR